MRSTTLQKARELALAIRNSQPDDMEALYNDLEASGCMFELTQYSGAHVFRDSDGKTYAVKAYGRKKATAYDFHAWDTYVKANEELGLAIESGKQSHFEAADKLARTLRGALNNEYARDYDRALQCFQEQHSQGFMEDDPLYGNLEKIERLEKRNSWLENELDRLRSESAQELARIREAAPVVEETPEKAAPEFDAKKLDAVKEFVEKTADIFIEKKTSLNIWIDGNTKPYKEELKRLGCRWANSKKKWYFRAA